MKRGTLTLAATLLTCLFLAPALLLAAGKPLKIAIVAPSAQNDLAFTQSMVDGIRAVQKERDIELAITDGTFVVEDAAAAIRDYAKKGYDLVIAHGSQYGGSLKEIAPDFPNTAFAWGTSADTFGLANVSSYEAASDEGGYVMGVMAAAMRAKRAALAWSAPSRSVMPSSTWMVLLPAPRRRIRRSAPRSTISVPFPTWPWPPRLPGR